MGIVSDSGQARRVHFFITEYLVPLREYEISGKLLINIENLNQTSINGCCFNLPDKNNIGQTKYSTILEAGTQEVL